MYLRLNNVLYDQEFEWRYDNFEMVNVISCSFIIYLVISIDE